MGTSTGPWTVLRGHSADVQAVEFLNAQHLFTGDSDGCVKLWEVNARRPVFQARLHDAQAGVLSLQCIQAPTGVPVLLSAGRDGMLHAHQMLASGELCSEPVFTLHTGAHGFCKPHAATVHTAVAARGMPSSIPSAAASGDVSGSWLIAWGSNVSGQVCLWDVRRPGTRPTLVLASPDISAIPFAGVPKSEPPSGQDSAESDTAGMTHTVGSVMAVRFRATGACTSTAAAAADDDDDAPAGAAGTGAQEEQLVVGYESGTVAVWDTRQPGQPTSMAVRPHTEPVLCLEVSPQGDRVLSGSADHQVHVWQLPGASAAEADLRCLASHSLQSPGVSHAAWRGDGRVVATGGWDGKVRVFSGKGNHKPLAVLKYHSKEVACVAWCPQPHCQTLSRGMPHVSTSDQEVDVVEDDVSQHSISQDAVGLLASASRDGTVALWRVFPWAHQCKHT